MLMKISGRKGMIRMESLVPSLMQLSIKVGSMLKEKMMGCLIAWWWSAAAAATPQILTAK